MFNRYTATRRIRSKPRKSAALDDVMARLVTHLDVDDEAVARACEVLSGLVRG